MDAGVEKGGRYGGDGWDAERDWPGSWLFHGWLDCYGVYESSMLVMP